MDRRRCAVDRRRGPQSRGHRPPGRRGPPRLIAEQNTRLNAIVTVAAESALAEADALDQRLDRGEVAGLLAGVPFTVKDLIATVGVRTTAASRALADNVPVVDAPAVAAMKAAGAILVGKTNTPEFGTSGLTDSEMFGPAVNPLGSSSRRAHPADPAAAKPRPSRRA